jgi:type III secretion protein V
MTTRSRSWFPPLRARSGTADLVVAGIVLSVVGVMVVPLPTWLLDLLLSANLTAAVSILLITLYAPEALALAAFPTLLLLTTLVRLGLNVSSTRLILLQADAGNVIRAFGEFVVAGNYVVGAVVFFILAVIQLVVIAKGSERVAEVGARFTLDAMPGKQLAIDAELKAGLIDRDEARARRRSLDRASQFYGAMDGAMKFVKGDVIASLIITAVNIGGGLAIGTMQRDLTVSEAARVYGLLTIGDGLVTQIPALLLATAAGILVTRVSGESSTTAVGEDLAVQLSGSPRALRVAAGFVAALGFVPGLPMVPFVVLGGTLLAFSLGRATVVDPRAHAARGDALDADFVPRVVPWTIRFSPDLARVSPDDARRPGLGRATERLRELLFDELGVPVPPARLEPDGTLPGGAIMVLVRELPVSPPLTLEAAGDAERVESRLVALALPVLRRRAADFLGMSQVQRLLDRLERESPGTVRQVVPDKLSLAKLTEILRTLVAEGVSIRGLDRVLEVLAGTTNASADAGDLAENVRARLAESLTYALSAGRGELAVLTLDHALEDTIEDAVSVTPAGRFLTLAPAVARDVVAAVEAASKEHAGAVLLTRPEIRRFARRLLETRLPDLAVVSVAELAPGIALERRAVVRIA